MHRTPGNYQESLDISRYFDYRITKIFKYSKKLQAFMYMKHVTYVMTLTHLNLVGEITTEIQTEQYLLSQCMFTLPVHSTTTVD